MKGCERVGGHVDFGSFANNETGRGRTKGTFRAKPRLISFGTKGSAYEK
jgi:hypothetical protein